MFLKGKPVPMSANSGASMVETASALAAERRTVTSHRLELLVARHVEDDGGLEHAIHRCRDRDRPDRYAMQEVGRAVQRVDDPHQAVAHQLGTQLLADDAPVGRGPAEDGRDERFRGLVDLGDEVAAGP